MMRLRKGGGRPRKDGPRHPSGQLVQKVEPNAKVVAIRRALLGEASAARLADAEDPMSLALARGWITEAQHRAGLLYASAWRRSHPQRRTPGVNELQESDARDRRPLAELSDAEIATAFDLVFGGGERSGPPSEAEQAEARLRYNRMSRALTADEQAEVFLCFCLASWPQWILQRCAGRSDTSWERKHRLLVSGLETLAAIRPRRTVAAAVG
ncbi:hypothetical protein LJR219_002939 [Phenylobacterium sp. LjRoot219]|uniref:hypothetical protein n=1 Tax=Phenylobacterium sp. LjRoot219 TaxID=3342283 RepID=UPI003ED03C1A